MFSSNSHFLRRGIRALLLVLLGMGGPGLASGEENLPVLGKPTPVKIPAWSPDADRLYTTCDFDSLQVWTFWTNPQGRQITKCNLSLMVRTGHHANSIAVGQKSSVVVLGTTGGGVELRDRYTIELQKSFNVGKSYSVYAVAIDHEEQRVAGCGTDGSVVVWNVDQETPLHRLPASREGERMASLAFSPDGKLLATLSRYGYLSLWDVATGKLIGKPVENLGSDDSVVQFTPAGDRLVVVSRASMHLWHPQHEPTPRTIIPPETVCPRHPPADPTRPGSRIEFGHGIRFAGVATLFPDAKRVACVLEDGGLGVWELATERLLYKLPAPKFVAQYDSPGSTFRHIQISPDGQRVAASVAGELVVWQLPE